MTADNERRLEERIKVLEAELSKLQKALKALLQQDKSAKGQYHYDEILDILKGDQGDTK